MNKTEYYDCFTVNVVERMYTDAVCYFKGKNPSLVSDDRLKLVYRERLADAKRMLSEGALSVDVFTKRDGTIVLRRNGILPTCDLSDVMFLYELRLNARMLYDVVRYDYSDEDEAQKDVKKEEYGVEYKGTTYVFDNAYDCDLVESMSRLIKHKGDDVSGTEFGYMIKSVFRLLGVYSDWL